MARPLNLETDSVNMTLPVALKKRLAKIAAKESRNLSEQIRYALERYAADYETEEKKKRTS